jgi:hypothetical protein
MFIDWCHARMFADSNMSEEQIQKAESALGSTVAAFEHPVRSTLAETEYFDGPLLEMMPGR